MQGSNFPYGEFPKITLINCFLKNLTTAYNFRRVGDTLTSVLVKVYKGKLLSFQNSAGPHCNMFLLNTKLWRNYRGGGDRVPGTILALKKYTFSYLASDVKRVFLA